NMYANTNNPFSDNSLNTSGKQLRDKTAASADYFSANSVEANDVKVYFDNLITEMGEVASAYATTATPGNIGSIDEGKRLVNEKGLEINQAIIKGLMGANFLDQALNNYLSLSVLDAARAANDAGTVEEGKNYTTMEHKWDEAYGYIFGDPSIPTENPNSVLNESQDRLLFNYLGRLENDTDFAGIAKSTFEAFKTGRAAIEAGEYELRDEQVAIIRENLSMVIAVR